MIIAENGKPVAATSPGGVNFGSSQASGYWTNAICRFSLENNGFYCGVGDSSTQIDTEITYTNGNWYHLSMVLDTSTDLYYLSINGTVLNPEGYQAASATPEWFSLGAGNNGQNTMYYDNVKVYTSNYSVLISG